MKIIETDKSEDESQVEEPESALWRTVAASVRGSGHEKSGLPCQDSHSVEPLPAGVLIVAVADGAGSAAHSEIGATVATRAALDWLSINQDLLNPNADGLSLEKTLRAAVEEAREKVLAEAAEREINVCELASTLIVVAATPTVVACAQVGDGAAVVNDQDQRLIALTKPQFGEYINETTFLTSADALTTLQSKVWRGAITHLAVFSDGLELLCLKLPEGTPHSQFFAPLFHFVSGITEEMDAQTQLEEFLRSAKIRQFTDDDVTLVLATFPQRLCPH